METATIETSAAGWINCGEDPLPDARSALGMLGQPIPDCGSDPRFNPDLPMGLPGPTRDNRVKFLIWGDEYSRLRRDRDRIDWIQKGWDLDPAGEHGDVRRSIDLAMQYAPQPGK